MPSRSLELFRTSRIDTGLDSALPGKMLEKVAVETLQILILSLGEPPTDYLKLFLMIIES